MSSVQNFVGIDISKQTFDVALLQLKDPGTTTHRQFQQTAKGFDEMKEWLQEQNVLLNEDTLLCMEFTGVYNTRLVDFLCDQKARLWVEMAIRIKKSEGFKRSSNDKTDAIKIAYYAYRYQDKKKLWTPTDERLNQIKNLIAQRDRVVESISKLTVPVNELKEVGSTATARQMENLQKPVIKSLEAAQAKIETAITKMIAADEKLSHKVELVKSIKGIGNVTAIAFLVYTQGFTTFESGKQLACYCGVVPFIKKQSGTSVKSKPKVSPFANQKLKSLLHLCAVSARQHDPELKEYFERKVKEGKSKMSVTNAIRNKLVLRMYAVVRDDRNFVENYGRTCA